MRLGMVESDVAIDGWMLRIGLVVGNRAGEGGGYGQTAGLHMIFHVIVSGMREDDRGLRAANDGGDFGKIFSVVKDIEVVADWWIKGRSKNRSRLLCLSQADLGRGRAVGFVRAAASVGDVHVVNFPTDRSQAQECSGRDELDVVGVGKEGEDRSTRCFVR